MVFSWTVALPFVSPVIVFVPLDLTVRRRERDRPSLEFREAASRDGARSTTAVGLTTGLVMSSSGLYALASRSSKS